MIKYYESNCCGFEIYNTEIQICPSCKEHCALEEVRIFNSEDFENIISYINHRDFVTEGRHNSEFNLIKEYIGKFLPTPTEQEQGE